MANLHGEAKPHPALTPMGLAVRHIETSELGSGSGKGRVGLDPKELAVASSEGQSKSFRTDIVRILLGWSQGLRQHRKG